MSKLGLKLRYLPGSVVGDRSLRVDIRVEESSSKKDFITNEKLRIALEKTGFKAGNAFGGFHCILRLPERRLDVYAHVPIPLAGPNKPGKEEFRGFGLGTRIESMVYSNVRRRLGKINKVRFYQITDPMLARLKHLGHSKKAIERGLTFEEFEKSIKRKRQGHLNKFRRK